MASASSSSPSDPANTDTASASASASVTATVQHVTKASSDKLLSKFAELEDDSAATAPVHSQLIRVPVRRKRSRRAPRSLAIIRDHVVINVSADVCASSAAARKRSGSFGAEWKALLPSGTSRRPKPLLNRMGIGLSGDAPGLGILLAALEKTWRKTAERASRVFVERHCNNRHVQLISDVV